MRRPPGAHAGGGTGLGSPPRPSSALPRRPEGGDPLGIEPLAWSDFRELSREAAPLAADLRWRVQSGPCFRVKATATALRAGRYVAAGRGGTRTWRGKPCLRLRARGSRTRGSSCEWLGGQRVAGGVGKRPTRVLGSRGPAGVRESKHSAGGAAREGKERSRWPGSDVRAAAEVLSGSWGGAHRRRCSSVRRGGEGGCCPPRGSLRPGPGPRRRPPPAARAVDAGGGAAPCRADGEAGGRFAVCGFSQRGPRG